MANFEVSSDSTKAVMNLQGNLNVEHASELHRMILETLQKHEVVQIDMSNVESVDLTFLQLVCALYKEAVRGGKRLIFEPIPHRIVKKAEKMGFTEEYTGGYFWKGDVDA
ncbi:MAG: STAS domain-containing protein [Desulfonatronovibrio sp. MSAO_Bac4]|nr:MAG: STAS domain-containing protein [Desulfonatronovibrio sp. MSAO_Bac4]